MSDDPLFSFSSHEIPHYYGDYVRALFLGAAVLSAVVIPVFGNLLPFGTFVQVLSALLLVLLAGLTNPHSRMLILYDTIISGVGVLLLESIAISVAAERAQHKSPFDVLRVRYPFFERQRFAQAPAIGT